MQKKRFLQASVKTFAPAVDREANGFCPILGSVSKWRPDKSLPIIDVTHRPFAGAKHSFIQTNPVDYEKNRTILRQTINRLK